MQEAADGHGVAVRQSELRVFRIKLEGMTRLAMGGEANRPDEAAFGIRLMAIGTVELLSIDGWNVWREMALMIEPEHIRVVHTFTLELELGMTVPESGKGPGKTLRWPGKIKDDLLGQMWMALEIGQVKSPSLSGGNGHGSGVVMTRRALRARNRRHWFGSLVFHVTDRAGTLRDHVWFMEVVDTVIPFQVADSAIAVDRSKGHAGAESFRGCVAKFHRDKSNAVKE